MYLHKWDERYHALVAKNLINDPLKPTLYKTPVLPYDYKNWTSNHIWLHKQPVPLWFMASSMKLFGVNEVALRLPSILLSTFAIFLTFFLGAHFFDKRIGLLAAFFHSINGLIIEITSGRVATDHIDLFFLVFIELSLVFFIYYLRKKSCWFTVFAGISLGLAILSKWLPALIVIPIAAILMFNQFRLRAIILQMLLYLFAASVVVIPWVCYIYWQFPSEAAWEQKYNLLHITQTLDNLGGHFFYHFVLALRTWNELILIPLVWAGIMFYRNRKEIKYLALFIWILIPYLLFSLMKTKMQAYLLFTGPAFFLLTAACWFFLFENRKKFKHHWLVKTLLIVMILLPVRYSIERIKPFEKRDRNPAWAADLRSKSNLYDENTVLFNVEHYVEAMFYTNAIAYPHIPDEATLNSLRQRGFSVKIYRKD